MQRRETIALVAGLVVGLIIGMILIGASDDLRESLFGTAGTKEDKQVEYYLVSLDDAEQWLAEMYPDQSEKFQSSVSVLTKLPSALDSEEGYKDAQEQFKVILPHTYGALVDEKDDIENLKADPNDELQACVGLDDDPYGATVYLYLTIPEEKTEKLDIPKEWEKLKRPKTNEVFWKLVACYPGLEEEGA